MKPVFYYDTNSPYAYLAAMRIGDVLADALWRPIAFGFIITAHGRVPWSMTEAREAGVREVEARAAARGLPPVTWVDGWPVGTYSLTPLRVALFAEERGVLREYTQAAYRLFFAEGRSLAQPETVRAAAAEAGLDGDEALAAAQRSDLKDRLREYTEEAMARGVVGVPTVAVDDQLFWGDDRLEDAAAAA